MSIEADMKITSALEKTFFTSDTHFGHANIIKYGKRPFQDVRQMDEALIRNWNETVSEEDPVFHLGDFTLGENARRYFAALNGQIHILTLEWHHDARWLKAELGKERLVSRSGHPVRLLPALTVLSCAALGTNQYALPITVSHYPLADWEASHHGAWQLHGHSHGTYADPHGRKCLDVGVDAVAYRPVSLKTLAGMMRAKGL
jgi:calcineurin-like phosphoesterase family protein